MSKAKNATPPRPTPWFRVTTTALQLLIAADIDPLTLLNRQHSQDWGEVDEQDRKNNEIALQNGGPLLSLFPTRAGCPVVVLTEAGHLFVHVMAIDESASDSREEQKSPPGMDQTNNAKFPLGMLMMTPGAIDALNQSGEQSLPFLIRHATGDWGELSDGDQKANQFALLNGERLLSAYQTKLSEKLWVVTEADRACTTILLPDEY